jgi:NAD+ kinase
MQKAFVGDKKEGDEEDTGFDIDIDNDDADRDSGYSAEGSSLGGRDSPMRKGVFIPFI